MASVFAETCTGDTTLMFAVDDTDPRGGEYLGFARLANVGVRCDANGSMVEALNNTVRAVLSSDSPPFAVAFMGDDHRPRTVGWDARYLETLRALGTGMVFGDDRVQGESLPTHIAMTADIPRALGWMAPPTLHHLYVDNFWRDLGVHAGCIRYLSDVTVEHMHPVAGTAEMDAGYERVNAPEVYRADEAAYRAFKTEGAFRAAVDAVQDLRPDERLQREIGKTRALLVAEACYLTGGRTVADIAPYPTDLRYLLGPALQVRHGTEPIPADIMCATGANVPLSFGVHPPRAVVTAGFIPSAGFRTLRVRMIGSYPVALSVPV